MKSPNKQINLWKARSFPTLSGRDGPDWSRGRGAAHQTRQGPGRREWGDQRGAGGPGDPHVIVAHVPRRERKPAPSPTPEVVSPLPAPAPAPRVPPTAASDDASAPLSLGADVAPVPAVASAPELPVAVPSVRDRTAHRVPELALGLPGYEARMSLRPTPTPPAPPPVA